MLNKMLNGTMRCYHCNASFTFSYAHSGFSDEHFFYCDTCGATAIVDWYTEEYKPFYEKHIDIDGKSYDPQKEGGMERFEEDTRCLKLDISQHLENCSCGGRFSVDATPRCPHCRKELEWDKVSDQIDVAFGAHGYVLQNIKKGWRDIWCFDFNDRLVENPWKKSREKGTL